MSTDNENQGSEQVATAAAKSPSAVQSRTPFFGDGYTITAEFPASVTGFDPVTIVYRPITADEKCQFDVWQDANPTKPNTDFYAPLLVKHKIIDWNMTNHKGVRIEVSEKNIRALAPQFYSRLLDVIGGYLKLPTGETEAEASLKN